MSHPTRTRRDRPRTARVRLRRALLGALTAVTGVVVAVEPGGLADAGRATEAAPAAEGTFRKVGELPVFGNESTLSTSGAMNGWTILNPSSRRGYQLFERAVTTTEIQSFDLDTLRPLRRVTLTGVVPILGGGGGSADPTVGGSQTNGEVVHAVDEAAGRVYIGLSEKGIATNLALFPATVGSQDSARAFKSVLVLDEARFDRGEPESSWKTELTAPLPAPAEPGAATSAASQNPHVWLKGMEVMRGPAGAARLLLLFAGVGPLTGPLVNHELARWNPVPAAVGVGAARPAQLDWAHRLVACGNASMYPSGLKFGAYQAEMLVVPGQGIYLACQGQPGSGRVVKVVTGADGVPRGEQQFLLSRGITESIADPGGRRLVLLTPGGGETWWVFDAARDRFVGSFAGALAETPLAAGLDRSTGRFYSLVPNHVFTSGGRSVPQRGGLLVSDVRVDPVPAAANVAPGLAHHAKYRILVDPPTRRVFVRRGFPGGGIQPAFPDHGRQLETPHEFFYHVFEDGIPAVHPPADPGDGAFTTDVDEREGVTAASYDASGGGYGARSLLVGGISAATGRHLDGTNSPCGPEDREVLAGSVERAALSSLSADAGAASLDADAATKASADKPVSRCWSASAPAASNPGAHLDPLSPLRFDADRDGADDYLAECVGDQAREVRPRPGFRARAECARADERTRSESTGRLSPETVRPEAAAAADGVAGVRVGHAQTEVDVRRDSAGGVRVRVDSVARDVVVDLGVEGVEPLTIGLVRAVAESFATGRTGRDAGARGTFERTVCGLSVGSFRHAGCISEQDQQEVVAERLNAALEGYGKVRLRRPDPGLAAGSRHGYQAAVQRDGLDLFEDQFIARDASLAVPGLEIVLFMGDDRTRGSGRQIVQLAGVQAATSYGITCLEGRAPGGGCAGFEGSEDRVASDDDGGDDDGGTEGVPVPTFTAPGDDGPLSAGRVDPARSPSVTGNPLVRALRRLAALPADVLRLLFSSPGEFALLGAMWALLWAPCYLGERRRAVVEVAAARAVG